MNDLDSILLLEGSDKCTGPTGHGYATTYAKLFEPLRNEKFTLIEIGVYQGASVRAWLQFFPNAQIVGIDCLKQWATADPRFTLFEGRQEDVVFLDRVLANTPTFSIVIDDGSHKPADQYATFKKLWPALESGGMYVIEDVQCYADAHQDGAYTDGAELLLWRLFSAVNLHGREYIGRPGPPRAIDPRDREYDSIYLAKGLIVIKKK